MGNNNTTKEQWESLERSQQQRLLAGLGAEHRETLTSLGEEVTFQEDEVILRIGEPSQHFYLLLSGSVSVEVVAQHYRARVQALGRGQVFGWSSLLDGCDTLFEVRALEPTTALRFRGTALNAMCRQNPAFGVELLRWVLHSVAGRVLGAETKLAEFCGVSARRA